jgi:HSP20 family protein
VAAPVASDDSRLPALDVTETATGYSAQLDLPGVSKEDVKVSIEGRLVTVQAKSQRSEEKKEGERLIYRERAAVSFARTFKVPVEVDQAESGAKLENGVLTLTLSKRALPGAGQITVN